MITIENLTYRYGTEAAVEDVSVTIEDGSFVVLTGANGSGKTTLVRHWNGLLEPDAGRVAIDGRDITESPVYARTSVGMVFQNPRDQFVGATVGTDVAFGPENLGLTHDEIDDRVETALEAVEMSDRKAERIDELSGGEQARVAIAGALAMEPAFLVLDEPFSGLDQPARESVLAHLDALTQSGTGIVVVTHDLRDLLGRADRLLGMADGRLVSDVPPSRAEDGLDGVDVRIPDC